MAEDVWDDYDVCYECTGYGDDYDVCYECTGYGDDYYMDEHGELVCACDDCPFNGRDRYDD